MSDENPKTSNTETEEFNLELDVSNFAPNEVTVHSEGRYLTITAEHQENLDEEYISRHFIRKYFLPAFVDLEAMTTDRTSDGILKIKAPYKAQERIKELEESEKASNQES